MKKVLLAVVACALASLVGAAGAQAQAPFVNAGSMRAVLPMAQLSGQQRVAVEHSTGRVFVADGGNDRVVVFDPTAAGGSQLIEFGATEIDAPVGIAIDQSTGTVYVTDSGNERIARYVSDGAPSPYYALDPGYVSPSAADVGSFAAAIAIDPSTGDLLVADPDANAVKRFDGTGNLLDSFDGSDTAAGAFTDLLDIAVDSTGDILVVDSAGDITAFGSSRVERFDASGVSEGAIGELSTPSAVTVIPGTDEVAVASNQNSAIFGQPLRVTVFDAAGTVTSETDLAPETTYGRVTGLAADDDDFNRLYVSTTRDASGSYGVNAIQRLVRDLRPTVTVDPASDVTATTAAIAGTVDPNSRPTAWQVEYRQAGETDWIAAPATPEDAGTGDDPVPAEIELTGLRPNTDYQWRLVARNEVLAATVDGHGFHTADSPPRADTLVPTGVKRTSIRLTGLVDPYGHATTYRFEYGPTTAYGNTIPTQGEVAGSGHKPIRVFQDLQNLIPGQTIHYRITATNTHGTTVGQNRTITLPPADRAYELVSPPNKNGSDVFQPRKPQGRRRGWADRLPVDRWFRRPSGHSRQQPVPVGPDLDGLDHLSLHPADRQYPRSLPDDPPPHLRRHESWARGEHQGARARRRGGSGQLLLHRRADR